jgi:hypothetical protein
MNWQNNKQFKSLVLKIAISWLSIFILGCFILTINLKSSPVALSVLPEVPKVKEPVVATFSISNFSDKETINRYDLFINGELTESGIITIAPKSSSKHQFAYTNYLDRGEQVIFTLKTTSESGSDMKVVSLPAYPPQLMSSFVSFAAFSTSVMSAMISMEYFNSVFGSAPGLNTGIIIILLLTVLLIFMELSKTETGNEEITILGQYRLSLGNMTTILFIIFLGMVFTKTVLILSM